MAEFKTIEQGIHNGKQWKVLQAVEHSRKQFINDYFFQWEDEDPKWIPGIGARAISIEFGEYPAECAKYFLTD